MVNTWKERFNALPVDLRNLLNTDIASLPKALEYLEVNTPKEEFKNSRSDWIRSWETTGLFYFNNQMFYQAIGVFKQLYENICSAEKEIKKWIHKGMPLVWLRDCHWRLRHRALAQRFILLTLIEDSIEWEGKIDPNKTGIYHRFCWEHGFTHAEFNELSNLAYVEYQNDTSLGIFPECILQKLQGHFLAAYPSENEADLYIINPLYAQFLIEQVISNTQQTDGKKLEDFASYMLSCVPGFEIESRKKAKDYHFDGFVRNRGLKWDFRSDLGNYLLVECKDWSKPADVEAISYFAHKLQLHDCRAGIIFSKKGITGAVQAESGGSQYAALALLKSYHHAGRIIMVLDEDNFKEAVNGKNLIQILQGKYEQVRFDLP